MSMLSRASLSRLRRLLSPKTLPLESNTFVSKERPIFIGGCGRSGTTLLRAMLSRHSALYGGPELNVHTNLLYTLTRKFPLLPRRAYTLYEPQVLDELSGKFDLPVSEIMRMRDDSVCLADFMERLLGACAARAGKERWIEKTPKNVTILPFIFKYFPDAKFIHVVRDGRDVVCSLREHPKYIMIDGERRLSGIINPLPKCLKRWVDDVSAALPFRTDTRYMEVKYEELLSAPRETLERVAAFIGVPWEEGMLAADKELSKGDARFTAVSENAFGRVDTSRTGRFRRDLSARELALVGRVAGPLLRIYGYLK